MDARLQASHIAWEEHASGSDSLSPDDLRRTFVPPNLLILETESGVECLGFYSRGTDGQESGRLQPLTSATNMQRHPGPSIASGSKDVVERPRETGSETALSSQPGTADITASCLASPFAQSLGRNSDSALLNTSGTDKDKWDLPDSPRGESVAWKRPVQETFPTPAATFCPGHERQQDLKLSGGGKRVFDEPTSCNPHNVRTTSK